MTDDQIKHMANRFLAWKLPEHFHPDNGISFTPPFADEPMRSRHWPIGTNLFDAVQAEAMVRYLVEELPAPQPPSLHREPIEADREAAADLIEAYWQGSGPQHEQMRRLAQSYRDGHTQGVWADAFMRHRLAFSTPAASDAETMARALKAAHEALSRANVTAYLDMPEDTADVVARAVIAALPLPKTGEDQA